MTEGREKGYRVVEEVDDSWDRIRRRGVSESWGRWVEGAPRAQDRGGAFFLKAQEPAGRGGRGWVAKTRTRPRYNRRQ